MLKSTFEINNVNVYMVNNSTLHLIYTWSGSVYLIGLDKMSTHVMGFEPMIKILSTVVNHRLHHALNAGLLKGLVVDQNLVDLDRVSPKTTTGKNVTLKFYLNYKLEATRNFNLI